MYAKDVMTRDVITMTPETSVADIAKLLLFRRISAVPVVDRSGQLIGIVSEGDLMHRSELDTEAARPWWLSLFESPQEMAKRFVKVHGRCASDVMTRNVITATEDTPLSEIAMLFDRRRIKRVPIVRDGKLVGIVSRADLLRGLLSIEQSAPPAEEGEALREAVMKAVRDTGISETFITIEVTGRTVHIWGTAESAAEQRALRVAIENTPGVDKVVDNTSVQTSTVRALIWD